MQSSELILVAGATGAQGGAAARELLARGYRVRILARNPDAPAAQALIGNGAEAVRGDLDDVASIEAALRGVSGVFSVQLTDSKGTDSERRQGFALVRAAQKAGVHKFVHTSVTGAGEHENFPRWGSAYWNQKYWTDKWEVEQAVRAAGFAGWTILKPAFMMENFMQPKAQFMFPQLRRGEIATALLAATRMQMISADDVGAFAGAAFDAPELFSGRSIDLAVEALAMSEIAATLSRELGKKITALALTPAQALERGLSPGWVRSQEWSNAVGYRADIDALRQYPVALTPFAAWAHRHRDEIIVEQ
jgi:uncharacterized protein YbjT (DUF2867 family)